MPTIESIVKSQQPEVYCRLMAVDRSPKKKKSPKLSSREIQSLMQHPHYQRIRGAVRQVTRGWR